MESLQAEFARLVERQDAAAASADAAVSALAADLQRAAECSDAVLDNILAPCFQSNVPGSISVLTQSQYRPQEIYPNSDSAVQTFVPMDGIEEATTVSRKDDGGVSTGDDVGEPLRNAVNMLQKSIASDAKDVASRLGKFSKLIDTHAGADLSAVVAPNVRVAGIHFNAAVSAHFYRAAMFDIAESFTAAAHVSVRPEDIQPFETLHHLLSSFRAGDIAPAIEWVRTHRNKLTIRSFLDPLPTSAPAQAVSGGPPLGSSSSSSSSAASSDSSASSDIPMASDAARTADNFASTAVDTSANLESTLARLEFFLRRLHFLDKLEQGERDYALQYARQHLVEFVRSHLFDVQKLMACLLFAPNIAASPYRNLVAISERQTVERMLGVEYCRAMGLAVEAPLLSIVRCGAIAVPVLLKASRISPPWKGLDVDYTLPVEIETGRDCHHHSIFTCPVSREEVSAGNNSPMILPCGHVLSKQSISRLPRGNPRFKCPYCPREQLQVECRPVYF
jgi:CTLH/CRA C-terminal to LisH motif domain/RING-type zinc-finger